MFAIVRIALGIWSFFVPAITKSGFHTLAWILTGFLVASALLGLFFAPSNAGKSLTELHPQDRRRRRFSRTPQRDPAETR
jgi:inositol transporter-like SP family MFS transporter